MSWAQKRFRDDGRPLEAFAHEFLVECPDCGSPCKVQVKSGETNQLMSPRVVACFHCGLLKEWNGKQVTMYNDGRDWYFGYQLRLQTPCCGETLWALNSEHLEYLEEYFGADVREQRPNLNRSMISRLPEWMKQAKNKKQVLKGLQHLRTMLPDNKR